MHSAAERMWKLLSSLSRGCVSREQRDFAVEVCETLIQAALVYPDDAEVLARAEEWFAVELRLRSAPIPPRIGYRQYIDLSKIATSVDSGRGISEHSTGLVGEPEQMDESLFPLDASNSGKSN